MKLRYFQKGFNFSQDGPGNRLVYHLHGCNLFCPWCANPEGMRTDKTYKGFPVTEACVSDIIAESISCMPMFFDGGGVTLTGGEVSLQLEAVTELLKGLKNSGINTCIETNGTHKALTTLFPYLDRLIIDMKSADKKRLKAVTGADTDTVLSNIKTAAEQNISTLIRIPLIGGFNDDDESIEKLINAIAPFKDKADIELLTYHEYGKEKWEKCGLEYTVKDAFIKAERLKEIRQKFLNSDIKTIRT